MHIEHYSFGKIIINGNTYSSDVIVFPDRVQSSWWRKEGHLLQIPDLKEIMAEIPPVLIIGTGFYGSMRVQEETLQYLNKKKIETHVMKTGEAVERFNKYASQKHTVAALHLTC
jgi:hypothetical protein